VIVRILSEGQYELDDEAVAELNTLDEALTRAIDTGDDGAFRAALSSLLDKVRDAGKPLPVDSLQPSDFVLPDADAHVDDVREMLGDEGLVPG
jgi:PspAA-like protein